MKNLKKLFLFSVILQSYFLQSIAIHQNYSPFYDQREKFSNKPINPEFIIIHFTANCSSQESWRAFFNFFRPVSAHYLIDVDGKITQMVDESKRAWHAGESFWHHHISLNNNSIGIEIINPGFSDADTHPCTNNQILWNKNTGQKISGSDKLWYQFTDKQIESCINLCTDIMQRYKISSCNVLGHSDVAPGRKVDPGPLFPWQKLANHGIGIWWNNLKPIDMWTPEDVQKKLKQFGYHIKITGLQDEQTTKVIQSFQMHFQQNNISGIANEQTIQILNSLLEKMVQEFDK